MRQIIVTSLLALSTAAIPALAQQPAQPAPSAKPAPSVQSATGGLATSTSEPGKVSGSSVVKASAKVAAIDSASRKITLKGQDGGTFDIVAGEEVKNFSQINVGDTVSIEYARAFAAEVRKTKKGEQKPPASVVKEAETVAAKPGQKPAGAEGVKLTILADVIAVDPKKSTITVKGPKGNVVVVDVKNPDHFKVVKKGDQIELVYFEAVAVAVTSSK